MSAFYFDRPIMKQRAKEALRGHWGAAVVIVLISTLLSSLASYASFKGLFPQITLSDYFLNSSKYAAELFMSGNPMEQISPEQALIASLITLAMGILINGIYQLAMTMWFLGLAQGRDESTLGDFFGHFSEGLPAALLYIWMQLWILIWMVPGVAITAIGTAAGMDFLVFLGILVMLAAAIYKTLHYSFCFYALADEPSIGPRQALNASKTVMKGHFGQVILLYLSFLGWMILMSIIPLFALYVTPYLVTTVANAWLTLRDRAFDEGSLSPEAFGMQAVCHGDAHSVRDDDFIVPASLEDHPEDMKDASPADVASLEADRQEAASGLDPAPGDDPEHRV